MIIIPTRAVSIKAKPMSFILSGEKITENRVFRPNGGTGTVLGLHQSGPNGGIVAVATVKEILDSDEALTKYPKQERFISDDCLVWIFSEIKTFPIIPCKGSLSTWIIPEPIRQIIKQRLNK